MLMRIAVARCTQRSPRVKRSSSAGWRIVAASVGLADPGVDVVTLVFPEPGRYVACKLDAAEPLARFVAVHRSYVEADRAAVVAGDGRAEHLERDEHIAALCLRQGEAFGVGAVERREPQGGRALLDTDVVEQIG